MPDQRLDHRHARLAVIGNHVPRRCGIATFTTDLAESLATAAPQSEVWVVAMNDRTEGYPYPDRVHFEIGERRQDDYLLAAEFLNSNGVELASLQHEYGIFGGPAGAHILDLIGRLRMPVVTTLHTVLDEPSPEERDVTAEIARLSAKLVVMSRRAVGILRDTYNVPEEKIAFVHHGIPDLPFIDPSFHKEQFSVADRTVAATFGLLSPNKGIEHMVEAMPRIVASHPDLIYLVLGVTHPNVKEHDGERYRTALLRLAENLGVAENIRFLDHFADLQELGEFLGCADVYVTPYANEAQITSGTLAYAMGSGKAVVSTPYWYATEMLAEGRGVITPFGDAQSLATNILTLLDDPVRRHAIRKRAYLFTRNAVWSTVATEYFKVFAEARERGRREPTRRFAAPTLVPTTPLLPPLEVSHLRYMTDDTGLLQHARFNVPDRTHGYCTDDNARALVLFATARDLLLENDHVESMTASCLSFLAHALDPDSSRFRNFMTYERRFEESEGSEDSQGRALWALGVTAGASAHAGHLAAATWLFNQALPAADRFVHPRSSALALVGINAYLKRFPGDSRARRTAGALATRIETDFRNNATDDWFWFDDILTYDNGKPAQALIVTGASLQNAGMIRIGIQALEWLTDVQLTDGQFTPIGNDGWYRRGRHRARFDQQPIEAQSMIEAYCAAHSVTGAARWAGAAEQVFRWFLGHNDLNAPLYDPQTGACCDGLGAEGPNLNQGAESTLAWLLSLADMHRLRAAFGDRAPHKLEVVGAEERDLSAGAPE